MTAPLGPCIRPLNNLKQLTRFIVATILLGALLLGGCAIKPQPLTSAERRTLQALRDVNQVSSADPAIDAASEPLAGQISLEEAIARAVKYNLDYRLIVAEQALRVDQAAMAKKEMLPRLAANAGWLSRSEENLSVSENIRTGQISNDPFRSQDKTRETADLTLTWDILDFGVSYYQARQGADQVMVAEERRRRIVNQIAQQVRNAYWRAATVEPLWSELTPLLDEARQALDDARNIETQRLTPPLEILYYQKGLVEVIRDLEALQQDLAIAKAELATLMGLAPGTEYSLQVVSPDDISLPVLSLTLEEMEEIALNYRPEIREEAYQKRVSSVEVKKALLRILPALTLNASVNYDSNSYLVYNDWTEVGARLTWNLMNLVTGPTSMKTARAQQKLSEVRHLATSMATLTQVHVGYQQYQKTRHAYDQAQVLGGIERRIFEHIDNAAANKAQSPLQRIRAKLSALFAESARYRSFAELQNAVANLYVTMGLSPIPEAAENLDLTALKDAIGKTLDKWNAGNMPVDLLTPETTQ